MQTHQEILNELSFHFDKVTDVIKKYPNAIKINNVEETGYNLVIDLDLIEIPPKEAHRD